MAADVNDALSKLAGGVGAEKESAQVIRAGIECVEAGLWRDKEASEALTKVYILPKLRVRDDGTAVQSFLDAPVYSSGESPD